MNESTVRNRQPIDIAEFERRLLLPEAPTRRDEDPLAELARLVDGLGETRQAAPHAAEAGWSAPPPPLPEEPADAAPEPAAPVVDPLAGWEADLRNWENELRGEPEPATPARAPTLPPVGEFDRFETPEMPREPMGSTDAFHAQPDHFSPDFAPQPVVQADHIDAHEEFVPPLPRDLDEDQQRWPDDVGLPDMRQPHDEVSAGMLEQADAPARRSGKRGYIYGAVALIAVLGSGALAVRGFTARGAKEAPTILAATGPTKVQPETQPANPDTVSLGANIGKPNEKVGQSRIVDNEERPVDLAAQSAPPRPGVNGAPAAAQGAPAQSAAGGNGFFPEPKRVKTVSVRPDGSIIGADGPVAAAPVPAPPSPPVAPRTPTLATVTQQPVQAAPKPAPSPAAQTPKATTRVATPKPSVPNDVADPAASKPTHPAPAAKPVQEARATPETDPKAASGGFAVQFVAAGSDNEAREKVAQLQSRFSAALSGHRLGVVKADVNGKTYYRVRAGGMSRDAAAAVCAKVKESGGNCIVSGG